MFVNNLGFLKVLIHETVVSAETELTATVIEEETLYGVLND